MKVKKRYHAETVVVGHDLRAVLYAYLHEAIYIHNVTRPPFRFDFVDPAHDLSFLDLENVSTLLRSDKGTRVVGVSCLNLWHELLFRMALNGQVPFSGSPVKLRLRDNNSLRVILKETKSFDIHYENLVLFDEANIFGLGAPVSVEHRDVLIYDWYDVNAGAIHDYDMLESADKLANEIYFYTSPRICGNTSERKDLVTVSAASREELFSIECSDLYTRLKTRQMMTDAGIRAYAGAKPKLTLRRRQIVHRPVFRYEFDSEHIVYSNLQVEDILNGCFNG